LTIQDKPRITVSAHDLAAGQGGICRVARLSVKALADVASVHALAVNDRVSHEIAGVHTVPFKENRLRFIFANGREILGGRRILYDFPGTARAHILGRWLGHGYAVWIHGYEMWERVRPDYIDVAMAADIVLVNSRYTLERTESCTGRIPQARICWLGTEDDLPPPPTPAPEGPPMLLFVGRSDDLFGKGQDLLIDCWPTVVSKVPDARLVFVGGGSELGRLKELAGQSSARGNIDVLGFVPEQAMDRIWRSATVFAMLGRYEGFGLVFTEAMRYSVPVIASIDDASSEINVDGTTGFNVSRSDASGLVDRIVYLISNRDRAAEFGRAGHAHWQEHFRFSRFKARLQKSLSEWL